MVKVDAVALGTWILGPFDPKPQNVILPKSVFTCE